MKIKIIKSKIKIIPDDLKTQEKCNGVIEKAPWLLHNVSPRLRTHGMCSRAIKKCLHPFRFTPDYLKKAVEKNPYQLGDFPDHLKTQEMCERAAEDEPKTLEYVPDHFKAEEMCKEVVRREPYALPYVPDHFKK